MDRVPRRDSSLKRRFDHCREELLYYRSRYYGYAECFLAELAEQPDFSLVGYDARRLSPEQRAVLLGLLDERPSKAIARHIVEIVTDALAGETRVDPAMLAKYGRCQEVFAHPRFPAVVEESPVFSEGDVSPVAPLQNLALRLGIPVEVKGREVRVPKRVLARHLDSPNPTIRRNLQACILDLQRGGYRLVNQPHRPQKRIDWSQRQGRLPIPLAIWQWFFRWSHLSDKRSSPVCEEN